MEAHLMQEREVLEEVVVAAKDVMELEVLPLQELLIQAVAAVLEL